MAEGAPARQRLLQQRARAALVPLEAQGRAEERAGCRLPARITEGAPVFERFAVVRQGGTVISLRPRQVSGRAECGGPLRGTLQGHVLTRSAEELRQPAPSLA